MPILQFSDSCISGIPYMCRVVNKCNYGEFIKGFEKVLLLFKVIDGGFLTTENDEEWRNSVNKSNKTQPLEGLSCFPICRSFGTFYETHFVRHNKI